MSNITGSDDEVRQSKYANTSRNKRVRINGEGTVYEFNRKLPSGKTSRAYRASRWVTIGGKSRRLTGQGATTKAAMASLDRAIKRKQVAFGELSQDMLQLTSEESALTVEQCIADWMRWNHDISDGTRRGYEAKIRLYLIPYFGSTPVRLLDTATLNTFFRDTLPDLRKPNGDPYLGPTAQRQVYFILHGVLEYAVKTRRIPINPLAATKPPKRTSKSPRQVDAMKQLSAYAHKQLMKHIQGDEHEARWMIALLGLRQSEALGLTDDCIVKRQTKSKPGKLKIIQQLQHRSAEHGCGPQDHKTREWPCGKQADRCPHAIGTSEFVFVDAAKTDSGVRVIPLVEPFYSVLIEHREKQQEFRDTAEFEPLIGDERFSQLLFTSKTGTPRRHQNDRREWHELVKRAFPDGPPPDLRLHDARHLAATMLSYLRVPSERIMRIMGWSPQTLFKMLDTYSHTDSSTLYDDMTAYASAMSERRKS